MSKKHNYLTTFIARTLLVLASVFMLANTAMAKDTVIDWQKYDKAVFTKSLKDDRPILLFVKADWCPHCKKMRETTLQDTSVIKTINESFIPVLVDADNDREIVAKYRVTGLPSFLILNGKDKVLKETSGEVTIVNFLQLLSQGHKKYTSDKI